MQDRRFKHYHTPPDFVCPFCGYRGNVISLARALYEEFDLEEPTVERPVCSDCFEDLSALASGGYFEDFSIYADED